MNHLLAIEYKAVIDGKTKTITETFLVEATGLGEVEKIIAEIFKTRIRNAQWHTLTQLRTLDDVIFHSGTARSKHEADPFYQVKAKFFDSKYEAYVPAEHADQAMECFLAFYPSIEPKYITLVKATNILGFWDPTSELWQGDFRNRSEILYDNGWRNFDRNQTELELSTQPKEGPTPPGSGTKAKGKGGSNQFPTGNGRNRKQAA